jgi:hypothetical protein
MKKARILILVLGGWFCQANPPLAGPAETDAPPLLAPVPTSRPASFSSGITETNPLGKVIYVTNRNALVKSTNLERPRPEVRLLTDGAVATNGSFTVYFDGNLNHAEAVTVKLARHRFL